MTALRRGVPDRVPWIENWIDIDLQVRLMAGRVDYDPGELCRRLGMSAFGHTYPSGKKTGPTLIQSLRDRKEAYYYPKTVDFDFTPPWIAETATDEEGRTHIRKGLLTSKDSLALFDEFLPDPDHKARYEQVARWIEQYREDFAVFARIRLGTINMLESLGIDRFAFMVFDEPDLVKEVHRRFSEWTARVVEHLNKMDFDFIWSADDMADNRGPWMSPEMYYEFFYPYQKMVADAIKKPWVFHSDGNLTPILDGLLSLGMSGIHPIQPEAMDISSVKRKYGHRVCILGNISVDKLSIGTPEEVENEVRERISSVGPGGGYIISSSNTLTSYMKTENVLAMAEAIKNYGKYPLPSTQPSR